MNSNIISSCKNNLTLKGVQMSNAGVEDANVCYNLRIQEKENENEKPRE